MPNYKTHLSGGCIAFAIMLSFLAPRLTPPFITSFEWLLFCLAGSLFPDVDIKSKAQYYFYWIVIFLLFILGITKRFDIFILVSLGALLPLISKHRGLFHRPWFIVCMPFFIWMCVSSLFPTLKTALWYDTLFFSVGAFSHVWLDVGPRKMFRL